MIDKYGVESNKGGDIVVPIYWDDVITSVLVFLFFIGVVAIIAFTVYKIVKMICLTITRNAEVKAFGSSAEYTEFLKWRQEQGRQ